MLVVLAVHPSMWSLARDILALIASQAERVEESREGGAQQTYACLVVLGDHGWISARLCGRSIGLRELVSKLPSQAHGYTVLGVYVGVREQPPPVYWAYPSHIVEAHLLVEDAPLDVQAIRKASDVPRTSRIPIPLLLAGYVKRHVELNIPLTRIAETLVEKAREGHGLPLAILVDNRGLTMGSPSYPGLIIGSSENPVREYLEIHGGSIALFIPKDFYPQVSGLLPPHNARQLHGVVEIVPARGYPRIILVGELWEKLRRRIE